MKIPPAAALSGAYTGAMRPDVRVDASGTYGPGWVAWVREACGGP
jgi:hypothetical protein